MVAADLRVEYGLSYSEGTILTYLASRVIYQFPAMLSTYSVWGHGDFDAIDVAKVVKTLESRLGQIAEEGTYYGKDALRLLEDPNSKSGYSELVWQGPLPLSLAHPDSPAFQR